MTTGRRPTIVKAEAPTSAPTQTGDDMTTPTRKPAERALSNTSGIPRVNGTMSTANIFKSLTRQQIAETYPEAAKISDQDLIELIIVSAKVGTIVNTPLPASSLTQAFSGLADSLSQYKAAKPTEKAQHEFLTRDVDDLKKQLEKIEADSQSAQTQRKELTQAHETLIKDTVGKMIHSDPRSVRKASDTKEKLKTIDNMITKIVKSETLLKRDSHQLLTRIIGKHEEIYRGIPDREKEKTIAPMPGQQL